MKPGSDLQLAQKLLKDKKYNQVINLLSPQVFLYRSNALFYFLLGFSCLRTNDYGGAYSYLKRGEDIEPGNLSIQLSLAVVYLRRREERESLKIWIAVLEKDPENQKALKGMELIKLAPENTDWAELVRQGRFDSLLPDIGYSFNFPVIDVKWIILFLALIATSVLVLFVVLPFITTSQDQGRSITLDLDSTANQDPLLMERKDRYSLSNQELETSLETIRRSFSSYDDNAARIEINRLLMSNAPSSAKKQVDLLLSNLRTPDFTNFKTNFSYKQVASDPLLHEGVYVRWQGKIGAVNKSGDAQDFEFFVGYDSSTASEGKILVRSQGPSELQSGDSIELIGKVFIPGLLINDFRLELSSIRKIVPVLSK